jgi:chemosensory pili system protein ChpB (putative protein-glutamate methylesterase)
MADARAGTGTRVVLLARPGPACDRLREALQEAGAELVLVADPTTASPEEVAFVEPQAILVALDASVEDSLERFDAVLSDSGMTVIFDEAELAAQRAGWDSARWVRHLAAKLNRHHDVLPPGTETEAAWHPSPGPIAQPAHRVVELDIAPFTGEAQQRAHDLPRDPGLSVEEPVVEDLAFEADALAMNDDPSGLDFNFVLEDGASMTRANDAGIAGAVPGNVVHDLDLDLDFELDESVSLAAVDDAAEAGTSPGDFVRDLEFELDDDGSTAVAHGATVDRQAAGFVHDLEDLDRRVASIELADIDSYGHGPTRGVVLVEAGLGGPDAVRQLLAELPEGFPRAVLVRLRLDGGRYDRLVKQMERATRLPVTLAQSGQAAEAGTVYFMAPDLGLVEQAAKLVFDGGSEASSLLAVLPAGDSAMLFLSGSDPALVEVAMNQAWAGALVAGQAPDGCYDALASNEVIARGGVSGSPSELAGRLAERWPS